MNFHAATNPIERRGLSQAFLKAGAIWPEWKERQTTTIMRLTAYCLLTLHMYTRITETAKQSSHIETPIARTAALPNLTTAADILFARRGIL
jgi:hypothetical protein